MTTADYRKLYIINITDNANLSLRGESQLQFVIEAMANYNGNIGKTCDTTRPVTSHLTTKLITLKGDVLWLVSVDESERNLFSVCLFVFNDAPTLVGH